MAKKGHFLSQLTYINTSNVPPLVKNVSDIGIDFSILGKRNSRTVDDEDDEVYSILSENEYLFDDNYKPYTDHNFEGKIKFLWNFADNNEIEFILHTIADNLVVQDEYGYFCSVTTKDIQLSEEMRAKVDRNFKKMYSLFGFDQGEQAWELVLQWLVEGYKTFEIIYNYKSRKEVEEDLLREKHKSSALLKQMGVNDISEDKKVIWLNECAEVKETISILEGKIDLVQKMFRNPADVKNLAKELGTNEEGLKESYDLAKDDLIPVEIIGFRPIASNRAIPLEYYDEVIGRKLKVWKIQMENQRYQVLSDNAIIQISYSRVPGNIRKISYAERLIRNFNLTRKLEESRVAWNILNAQFRLKVIVPVSNRLSAKAKQSLKNFTDRYKEELYINEKSGEITVNGVARLNFSKNLAIPVRPNSTPPEIEGISMNGPDLSNMDSVEYFRQNLWRDSFVPKSRFDRSGSLGALSLFKADGVPYDEIAFHNFIKRLKSEIEQLLKKPIYLQTLLDYPELRIDSSFRNKIGINFNTNSYFEEAKQAEVDNSKLAAISSMESATDTEGKPVFSKKFLYVHKYKLVTKEDWEINVEMLKEETPIPIA